MRKLVMLAASLFAVGAVTTTLVLWRGEDADNSPGERIAFVSDASGDHEVWVTNSDDTGQRRLTGEETPPNTGSLDWSPDGHRIVFTAYGGEGGEPVDIYVVDADRPGARRLTNTAGREILPQFLPDGSIFYWVSDKGGAWIIDDDGSNVRPGDRAVPSGVLSPDATLVLRTLRTGGLHSYGARVVTSDLPATYHRPLTEAFGYTESPVWSGNGDLIAVECADVEEYVVMLGAPKQKPPGICVLRPDGTSLRQVAEVGDAPTLSPDGDQVAFLGINGPSMVSTQGGESRPFLADCECLQVTELAWSPR